MIHGVGVDLVSLERFSRFARDHAGRLPEMFTAGELARRAELGRAFALKEAALKAIGGLTGWELDWREIASDRDGRLRLSGTVAAHAKKLGVGRLQASVSEVDGRVLATVIAERAK